MPAVAHPLLASLQLPSITTAEIDQFDYLLRYHQQCWQLQQTGKQPPGPVLVDFSSAGSRYRRNKGGGELIVRAVAGNKKLRPSVLDATAGLGGDSFVLASHGYPMTLMERSPIVALLLDDGLQRGLCSDDAEVRAIVQRMHFQSGDSQGYLEHLADADCPDVVYIDPMFPASRKSAQVKKEMQAFQKIVGADSDSAELLDAALNKAVHRVVVKRPLKAENLAGRAPSFALKGKAVRFDVYGLKAF